MKQVTNNLFSDCDKAVDTVPLPSSTTCSISSSCTAVDCCTNIDEFTGGMAVRTYVDLDPCAFTLTVGIEEINFTKSLIDYNWSKYSNEFNFYSLPICHRE